MSMWAFQLKYYLFLSPLYFTEFVGYNLFSLSLSFKSSSSYFFCRFYLSFLKLFNQLIDDFDRTIKVYQICVISKMMDFAKFNRIMKII